jgi:hypothetical protein
MGFAIPPSCVGFYVVYVMILVCKAIVTLVSDVIYVIFFQLLLAALICYCQALVVIFPTDILLP